MLIKLKQTKNENNNYNIDVEAFIQMKLASFYLFIIVSFL